MDGLSCVDCGAPLTQTIEGLVICSRCWAGRQQDENSSQCDVIGEWYGSHCMECGRPLPGGGHCLECRAEIERDEIKLEALLRAPEQRIEDLLPRLRARLRRMYETGGDD